jgi:phosphohistidine swiveling domain-containing protein
VTMKAAIYRLGSDIPGASKATLGGKAFGLHKMILAGIPVPPAYVIDVEASRSYMQDPAAVMAWVREVALPIISQLKNDFGYMPLVSVRSGAPVSMPGMMDTILNVCLDSDNRDEWEKRLGEECADDSRCRLVEMFANVVHGVSRDVFKGAVETSAFGERYQKAVGSLFPKAEDQLLGAIEAVFKSWNNERAVIYRKLNGISEEMGTAVVIQAMVFGNLNEKSGTGVAFSRDYSSGENKATGNWLPTEMKDGKLVMAQGEDVVAGIKGGYPLASLSEWNAALGAELLLTLDKLEMMERDMVDTEFTIQDGKFYMLQVRAGKRTAQAALKIAVDLFNEGMITVEEALERVTLRQFLAATRPTIPGAWMKANPAHGVGELDQAGHGASVGVATGVAVFSNEAAVNCKAPCILVRKDTTPDDIAGMNASVGILTATGAITCHAAVVGRGMDKVVVVGCTSLTQTSGGNWLLSSGNTKRPIKEGTLITLDGVTGSVWVDEEVPVEGAKSDLVSKFLDLLAAKYDFYRTVTAESELNGAKKVLLATYGLDRQFKDMELKAAMKSLLLAASGRDVVIDLRTFEQVCREADKPLEMLWGPVEKSSDAIDDKIQALLTSKPSQLVLSAFKASVKVLELGLLPDQIDAINMAGFETVPVISTVAELKAVNGLCVADFAALMKSASKAEVLKIIDKKRAAGEEVRSFNIVEKVSPDLLTRNAVFALSAIQAAQCLLSGKEE